MKKCLQLLEDAVAIKQGNPMNLAYLSDRINTFEGKEQLYGTQFDWDEKGEMSPKPIDDMYNVNKRRKSIGLITLQEQTELMRKQVRNENRFPPEDFESREKEIYEWRKAVGWIK